MNTLQPEGRWRVYRMWWIIAAAVAVCIACGIGSWYIFVHTNKSLVDTPKPVTHAPQSAPQLRGTVEGRYLFNGTIFWGRGIERWAQLPGGAHDYAHPFSGLDSFNRHQYDAWVADLECPITNKTVSFATQVDKLVFNCRPEYVAAAAKYFTVLNLANNHTDNMGPEGLTSTRSYLDQAGIQHVGHYDPGVASDVCEVVSLPVRVVQSSVQSEPGQLPVAFCAWHYFYRTPRPGEIEAMRAFSDVMPVFAFVHMGAEYYTQAQPTQVAIAHQVADQNPEFVIANNPHWVQNTEVYKGKLIVYSTGNFIFDQLDKEGMQSVSVDATMTLSNDQVTAKWLALGKACAVFHDDCLQQIKQQKLPKPKLTIAYDVVAGDNSNRLTKKASDAAQQAIRQRTTWPQTQAVLAGGQ